MRQVAIALCLLIAATASAQPTISSVAGALNHGATVTLNGNSFGTKAVAAPKIWDRTEGSNLSALWDDWEPTAAADPSCNMGYRTPIRGVSLPHTTSNTKYLAGCHYGFDTSNGGNIVQISDQRNATVYPYYSYWSYYWRMDPAWDNGGSDGNNKIHGIGTSEGVLAGSYWYTEYDGKPINSSADPNFDVYDSGGLGYRCRVAIIGACHSNGTGEMGFGPNGSANNPINGWVKTEILIRWDRTTAGYVLIYENGQKVYHTTGETDDTTSTTTRYEGIGLYSRARGITTWRYFDDVYFDTSVDAIAHVELCPGATFATRGVCQTQPLTAWSNTSVSFTMNRGALPSSGTAYAYVTDRNRSTNAVGFPVVIGGAVPTAPANLRIVPGADVFGLLMAGFAAVFTLRRPSRD